MCKATEDMTREAEARGEARGIFRTVLQLVSDGLLTVSQATEKAGLTEKQFREKACELGFSIS